MLQYCTERNFEITYLHQILDDYTRQRRKCHPAAIYSLDADNYTAVRVNVSYFGDFRGIWNNQLHILRHR